MLKWFCVCSCWLVLLSSGPVRAQNKHALNPVALEKAYQQVLYEYYQDNFFSALTQMAILEQKFPNGLTQIPPFLSGYSQESELLKGGMSLAYGLDDQATDIFQRLLKSNAAPDVSAYSWLLLGKTYYKKRQFADAAYALEQISQQQADQFFDPSARDNWLYMQSQLYGFLLSDSPESVAIKWSQQLSKDSIYRDYVQYNQALALRQKGESEEAIARLTILADQDTRFAHRWMGWSDPIFNIEQHKLEDERQAVRDRANLTLGYWLLQNNQPHQAFKVFENIRTNGLDSESALLGYGWAAAKKDDLQTALAIWQRLMQMSQNSEYVLEAYLASAYAYEKAFAPRQSLEVLHLGVERFKQVLVDLNEAEKQVKQRQFILDLLTNTNKQSNVDSADLSSKARSKSFKGTQLFNSIAISSEFVADLSALAQSLDLLQQLQNWQLRMQQYHLMLDERQAERLKRAKLILQNRTLEQLPQLQTQRDALALVLDTAKEQQDGQVFMSAQSQKWLERVKRSNKRLTTIGMLKKQLKQPPLDDAYTQRLKRVAGRLLWQASEDYSENQWLAQKQLHLLDSEIDKTQNRQKQLLVQLADKPDFSEQRRRVRELEQRIDVEISKNSGLQDALVNQLSATFIQFIHAHKQKVNDYVLQAQLAMVRLNDQALLQDKESTTLPDGHSTSSEDGL